MIALALSVVAPAPRAGTAAPPGPRSPEDALRAFEVEPGLKVELVAAEPLVVSPCAIAWDERGRCYVAENRGYPTGGPGGAPAGVIALLEDSNGDGRYDRRTEFATGLTFPNGLLPWRGGLIVTCAPEVFFFKDADGDGRAEVKEVLLTGFATNGSTQLRVNRPMLAPDGWVYLASGLSGGKITSPKRPGAPPLEMRGDVRFKPDTGEYEPTDGKSQFGQSFDDFGRRFGVFNRVQVQHFVLPSRYVERNPHLASPGVLQNCPELLDNPFLRGGGGAARIYPSSANITTADSHAGTFSAACAIHLYRSATLPEAYRQNAFSCDPTGNLVHRDLLESAGATFAARRVGQNVEFLRSSDDWFRPVYLDTGPDGALYVCDMYRKVIEHPEYLPVELRKHMDFDGGKDRGRLWRVTTTAGGPARAAVAFRELASASASRLVRELGDENAWRRETAFRLLFERRAPDAAKALRSGLARVSPPAAVLRLHLLASLDALDEAEVIEAMQSRSAGVREVALGLAERRLGSAPRLQAAVLRRAEDEDARVRFQCALALGWVTNREESGRAVQALARIGVRGGEDKWLRAAVLSSVPGREHDLLRAVVRGPGHEGDAAAALLEELGRTMAGSAGPAESVAVLAEVLAGSERDAERLAFLAGMAGVNADALRALRASAGLESERLREVLGQARLVLAQTAAPLARRLRAAKLLAADDVGANGVLLDRLQAGEPPELQAAVVRVLTQPGNPQGAQGLLSPGRWSSYSPGVRGAVLGALASRPEQHGILLDAIEAGAIPASAVDSNRREQLKRAKDETIRQRAQSLFASGSGGDRMKAFEQARACLALKPVPKQGREVFKRLCATCHRLDREGVAVGPDLFDIRNQPKESILLHIVLPELEIAPNFANYTCETRDGRTLSGLLVSEGSNSVTLRQAQGLEETVTRRSIISLTASPLSLMPQDLEKGMSPQELADLLGYLKGEE